MGRGPWAVVEGVCVLVVSQMLFFVHFRPLARLPIPFFVALVGHNEYFLAHTHVQLVVLRFRPFVLLFYLPWCLDRYMPF